MHQLIIGLTGPRNSGKTAIASTMRDKFSKLVTIKVLSFASPLKDFAAGLLKKSHLPLKDHEGRELVVNKEYTGRELIRAIAEAARNIDPDIFIYCKEKELAFYKGAFIIFDDVRFDNEAEFIKSKGGIIIKLGQPEKSHISEMGISDSLVDIDLSDVENKETYIEELIREHVVDLLDEYFIEHYTELIDKKTYQPACSPERTETFLLRVQQQRQQDSLASFIFHFSNDKFWKLQIKPVNTSANSEVFVTIDDNNREKFTKLLQYLNDQL